MKNYIISGLVALTVSLGVIWAVPNLDTSPETIKIEHLSSTPASQAVFTLNEDNEIVPLDFTSVSEQVMDAVVHIKSTQTTQYTGNSQRQYRLAPDPFRDFFDQFFDRGYQAPDRRQQAPQARVGTGSGVILSEEGYIVTNNHVIDNADDIEVTLHDNRSYKATVIGTDPSTDLALIKIDEDNLTTVPLIDSDEVRVGEWVLAVGNPFNLNSTVTAGIVSAKSRNINILRDRYAIESFIQTDAAINPGNSGGALVNLNGALVGINTAIASPTGAYSGYGFAVPANIVSKVVEDLLEYGMVQRGYLGVTIRSVDGNLAKEKDLRVNKGVYVDSVSVNSAAEAAGIEPGDVILAVDGTEVNTAPELQEAISRFRPGDELNVALKRNRKDLTKTVQLKNRDGDIKIVEKDRREIFSLLGAEFEAIDQKTADNLGIDGGVKVTKIYPGKLSRNTGIEEGFIITKVDRKKIRNKDDLEQAFKNASGGVLIEGRYEEDPEVRYYGFGMGS